MGKNILGFETAEQTIKFTLICLGMFVAGFFFFTVSDMYGVSAMLHKAAKCVRDQYKQLNTTYMKRQNVQMLAQALLVGGIYYLGMRTLSGFYCKNDKVEFGVAYMPFEYADAEEGPSVEAHAEDATPDYRSALDAYMDSNF